MDRRIDRRIQGRLGPRHATRVSRRELLLSLAAAGSLPTLFSASAHAHHGWSSFDESRPLYFEGEATAVRWQNPHAELELKLSDSLALPPDLAGRAVPAQKTAVDSAAVLKNATLPQKRGTWTVELAPLTRLVAWQVPEVKTGDRVAVIGYTREGEPEARTRAEYLLVGGKVYPLRSLPA
jgi:hypothetical protein